MASGTLKADWVVGLDEGEADKCYNYVSERRIGRGTPEVRRVASECSDNVGIHRVVSALFEVFDIT